MNYSQLATHLRTSATGVSGIGTFGIEYVENINNIQSKDYMYVLIFPIRSKRTHRSDLHNRDYTIEGFLIDKRDKETTEQTQFLLLEQKFDLFLTAVLADISVFLKDNIDNIERIPTYANDKLIGLRFTFNLLITQC